VQLETGPNTVEARATIDGKVLTDDVTWNAPNPAAGLRFLAGTLTGVTTSDGVRFGSDNFFVGGTPKSLTPFFVLDPKAKRTVAGTTTPQLYEAYREGSFRYELPLPDGKWNVTLHMFEPQQGKVGTRTFDVAAGGKVALHDFNPGAAAGGALKAVTRTFPVRVNHGRLDLEFTPKSGDALVSAIVVSH
jgi:beta-galactosidase